MDSTSGYSQYVFAGENETSLLENACFPNSFFLSSANPTGTLTNLEFVGSASQPEPMQVDAEYSDSKWAHVAQSPQDRLQDYVPDCEEQEIVPDCRKRCFTYNEDCIRAEDSVYTWDFEPSPKKHKGRTEYFGLPSSQCLPSGYGRQAWATMSPDNHYLYDYNPSSSEVGGQVYQPASNQRPICIASPQETSPTMLSSAGLDFDDILLEVDATEASLKLEGDSSSSPTGEQCSSVEEAPETPPVSVPSSESSVASPASSDHGKDRGIICNADSTFQLCDTCFGMIQTSFSNSKFVPDDGQSPTGVSLKVQEDFVLLYHRTSGKLAGAPDITMGRAMGQLSEQFMVVYNSFILPQDNSKKEPPGKYKLQTIIYGLGKDADAVGALLSTYDLFLQHPRDSDPAKLYSNPHYLSRPGRNMDIPQYTTTAGIDTCPDDSVLDEVGHARILQIFDSAQGPQKFLNPQIAAGLKTSLKDYQILALAMMFEKENGVVEGANFPSLWRVRDFSGKKRYYNVVTKAFEEQGAELRQGGLLADDMGLGKTLTTLAFIASSNAASNSSKSHNADGSWRQLMSLVVAPKTAIPVWEEQIQKHFESDTLRLFVYHGMARKTSNLASLNHHIVITTYETLSTEWSRHAERPLLSHLWHRVILDEAHVIRNSNSAKHRAVCDLKAHHRWCLTGTPVQNRIEDYGAILKFLRISPFLSKHKFNHYIANPIQSGRDEGFETLKTLVKATSLRRTKKSELKQCDLPRRQAILQSLVLGTREKGIYDFFKKRAANIVFDLDVGVGNSKHLGNILPTLTKLRQICNHSTGFLPRAMLAAAESRNETSLYDVELQQDRCDNCHLMFAEIQDIDLTEQNLPCSHSLCQTCLRVAQNDENGEAAGGGVCPVCPVCSNARSPSDHTSLGAVAVFGKSIEAWMEPSTKIIALLQNLRQDRFASTEDPFKSVVFSCWTRMLDLIEVALNQDGFKVQRIDGSKSLGQRRDALKAFREDSDCLVMLASIDCAGCGLDLTAANRVHLMEPQWNPMAEEQALDRVYRLGQRREVLSIRYIVKDSIEEYVQQIQKKKMDMISRTFGESGLSQHNVEQERLELLKSALR